MKFQFPEEIKYTSANLVLNHAIENLLEECGFDGASDENIALFDFGLLRLNEAEEVTVCFDYRTTFSYMEIVRDLVSQCTSNYEVDEAKCYRRWNASTKMAEVFTDDDAHREFATDLLECCRKPDPSLERIITASNTPVSSEVLT